MAAASPLARLRWFGLLFPDRPHLQPFGRRHQLLHNVQSTFARDRHPSPGETFIRSCYRSVAVAQNDETLTFGPTSTDLLGSPNSLRKSAGR